MIEALLFLHYGDYSRMAWTFDSSWRLYLKRQALQRVLASSLTTTAFTRLLELFRSYGESSPLQSKLSTSEVCNDQRTVSAKEPYGETAQTCISNEHSHSARHRCCTQGLFAPLTLHSLHDQSGLHTCT